MSSYKVNVPEGRKGRYAVERFVVTEEGARMFNIFGAEGRLIYPGTYTRLVKDGREAIMSDTPAEITEHMEPIERATGNVLIHGLGLGVVANACLMKPEVSKVTVVELEQDVIDLVAPHYQLVYGNRLDVVCADAFEYEPPNGTRFNVVWSDIWPQIRPENWNDIQRLKKKYRCCSDWHKCWVEDYIEARLIQEALVDAVKA